jgi:hypothetical protein
MDFRQNIDKKPLVDGHFLVEKQAHKFGWRYVVLPDIPAFERSKMGLIRVHGWIDTHAFKQFNLLPMKDGSMMLPIKGAIRKQIGKDEGDTVHVVLFSDDSPIVIPDDILVCLLESEKAHSYFMSISESNQKHYIEWIEEAKRLETKVERIAKMMERLEKGLKFYDW